MESDWQFLPLEEAPVAIIDGDRGVNYPSQGEFLREGYCLFLNAGNVTKTGFNFDDCAYISSEKDSTLRKGKLVRHDIVLTTRGTVGNVAYYDEDIPYDQIRINSGMVIFRVDETKLIAKYLYYVLKSPVLINQVTAFQTGSAQPQLPIKDINKITIPIPPLAEQRRIAHILGTFDDKIELNRRMNATLEAMARALFQSWFVDFDPVRAKMDGRWRKGESLPGLPAAWWDLFPDRLVDSELGPIPAGWRVGTLGDIFVNHNSKRIPISGDLREARKGNYPYYGATGILDFIDDFIFNGIFLLVGEDGSVQDSRGNGVTQYVWGKFWVNNHAHVLQGSDYISTEFLYLLMKNLVVTPFVTGAVQPKLSLGRLQMIPCIIPTPKIAQVFGGITENHFHLLRHYYDQTLLLEEFRDSLLPVLISHKE